MAGGPNGHYASMTIGTSILLIAAGAILKYAITADVDGVNLETVGVILMIVGILGLVISLILLARARDAVVTRDRVVERDHDPRY